MKKNNKSKTRAVSLLLALMMLSVAVFAGCSPTAETPDASPAGDVSASPEAPADASPADDVSAAPDASPEAPADASPAASSDVKPTLTIGMECNYAPFNWTQMDDSNGAVPIEGGNYANGYDVQIAKIIARDMGRELKIAKIEWDGLVPALNAGKIDGIIAGMSPTAERKESIDFTQNYYRSDLVIVVNKDGMYANAKSINDFKGAKITGQLNTFHYTVIDQIPEVQKQVAMDTFPLMIASLSAKKIDGYVSELPGAKAAIASNPNLTYIEFEGDNGFKYSDDDAAIAVGLAKGSDLLAPMNDSIAQIPQGTRDGLMEEAVSNQPSAE